MTSIISGQNISGSLTSNNPKIVDPTSPYNGQFYDDFDLSSVNVIDPNNLPFLLAASKEFGDIGSVKIGETRSTNIFVQPPAGSAPGASTVVQLINTKTNSVDAQSISSSTEALKFIKNAEIVGTDYKIRVINAAPGDYTISLAGAIQAVEVVGTTGTNPVEGAAPIGTTVDPNIARNLIDGLIYDSTGAVIGAARINPGSPTVGTDSPVSIDPPTVPPILTLPDGTVLSEQIPIVFKDNQPISTPSENGALPVFMTAMQPGAGSVDEPASTGVIRNLTLSDGTTSGQSIPDGAVPGTAPEIDSTLIGVDPVIYQNTVIPNIQQKGAPGPLFTDRNSSFLSVFRAVWFGISATSQKPSSKVNEIGIFVVDDASGKINGIAPGAAGYLKAATNSARSIFSTLGGNFFESSSKRAIFLEPSTYGFFEVQDGSIADLKQQLANGQTPSNVLFSTPGKNSVIPIQLTGTGASSLYILSVNKDELVLDVKNIVAPTAVIGAKSQGLAEGRTIDLTGITGTRKVDITTKSSAAYNNNIGFYKVEDSIGTIRLADGTTVKPGDASYAFEAIKNALANTSLQAGKTESKLGQNITGGSIYAPVVVSQGSLSDFIAINPTNIGGGNLNAYFNYVPANSDKKDHFRLLGDNTFGVEDQFGGGDRDFNDLVVNMNVKPA